MKNIYRNYLTKQSYNCMWKLQIKNEAKGPSSQMNYYVSSSVADVWLSLVFQLYNHVLQKPELPSNWVTQGNSMTIFLHYIQKVKCNQQLSSALMVSGKSELSCNMLFHLDWIFIILSLSSRSPTNWQKKLRCWTEKQWFHVWDKLCIGEFIITENIQLSVLLTEQCFREKEM